MLDSAIWNEILTAAAAQSKLEWLALFTNLAYVILAARGNRWCWFFGFFGAIFTMIVVANFKLYSDAILQVYYIAAAVYGWFAWQSNDTEQGQVKVETMTLLQHGYVFLVGGVLTIAFGFFWSYFDAAFPFIDGATTAFAFLATLLVAQRYIENWLYWIVIDLAGIGVYYAKELYLFSFLFIIYTILAIVGWISWKRIMKKTPARVKP